MLASAPMRTPIRLEPSKDYLDGPASEEGLYSPRRGFQSSQRVSRPAESYSDRGELQEVRVPSLGISKPLAFRRPGSTMMG